jgi:hypothetical protein
MLDGGVYKMWYTSHSVISAPFRVTIGYATSSDGIHWTKYSGNPVYGGPDPGTNFTEMPSVVKVDSTYLMAYIFENNPGILYASSTDGVNWKNASNPLIMPGGLGSWDYNTTSILWPNLLVDNSRLLLWFDASGPKESGIGLAYCGTLLVSTNTVVVTTISATTSTVQTTQFVTVTSLATETLIRSLSAPTFDVAASFVGGLLTALGIAVLLVWRATRHKPL